MSVIGIYPGTFDPITNGHLDIIKRTMQFAKELVIVVGINSNKKTLFSEVERVDLINKTIDSRIDFLTGTNIKVMSYQGLIVQLAQELGASVIVRGIRSVSDFEYEINLANVNKTLAPGIETVFLPTRPELAVVSSSMVKEIAKFSRDIKQYVPEHVAQAINNKFGFVKHGDEK
jgi:pantetheine-phosphate adenylyltransferase